MQEALTSVSSTAKGKKIVICLCHPTVYCFSEICYWLHIKIQTCGLATWGFCCFILVVCGQPSPQPSHPHNFITSTPAVKNWYLPEHTVHISLCFLHISFSSYTVFLPFPRYLEKDISFNSFLRCHFRDISDSAILSVVYVSLAHSSLSLSMFLSSA